MDPRQQELEDLLQRARAENERKEKLFIIMAHDLKGPIGTMREYLANLDDEKDYREEELRVIVPEMRKAADSAYDLLVNVLDWVRSQLDAISVLTERVFLRGVAERVASWLAPMAAKKHVRLEVTVSPAASAVVDVRIVETILRNLLSNAIKFSKPGGTVLLTAETDAPAEKLRLCVVDSGIGIPPELLADLFTMMSTKRRVGTAGERGAGLGLVFCRELAERLGGTLDVQSRVGEGSTFALTLPNTLDDVLA